MNSRGWMPARGLLLGALLIFLLLASVVCGATASVASVASDVPSPKPAQAEPPSAAGPQAVKEIQLMYWSLNPTMSASEMVGAMGDSGDASLLFPLVEMFHYGYGGPRVGDSLRKLSGVPGAETAQMGDSPSAWAEWLWRQEGLEFPAGFDGWKGKFLRKIAGSDYKEFIYNGVKTRIPLSEIIWGGSGVDERPALTDPQMVPAARADYLSDGDRVFGVALNGDYQAFPLWLMARHQLVNTVVGKTPVTLAYSPHTGSGILYSRQVGIDTLAFADSGLVYRNSPLMYDRKSQTLWSQFIGVPVVGRLAESELSLEILPVTLTTWGEWRIRNSNTTTVQASEGFEEDRDSGHEQTAYLTSLRDAMFPMAARDGRMSPKAWVFGVRSGDTPKAYPLETLRAQLVVNDTIADQHIVLVLEPTNSAVRAYLRGDRTFRPGAQLEAAQRYAAAPDAWGLPLADAEVQLPDATLHDGKGHRWLMTEEALVNESTGERLVRIPGHMAYWSAWYAFFPHTDVFGEG